MKFLGFAMESVCQSWQCLADGDDGLRGEGIFLFPAQFIGFNGHFPRRPVLPAVVQLAAVRCLAGYLLGREVGLRRFYGVKFRDMVVPDEEIWVSITLIREASLWQAGFSITKKEGRGRVAHGHAVFTEQTSIAGSDSLQA